MADRAPSETKNLDRYGHEALSWERPHALLIAGSLGLTQFLGTTRPDGRAHAAGVGALWFDGDLYFTSSPNARKARNLAANPACTMTAAMEGIDLVFEGEAARVTDADVLERAVAMYRESGWPCEVEGDAITAPYSAPSAGPPPWHLYRLTYHTVFGVAGAEPNGATRWRFQG